MCALCMKSPCDSRCPNAEEPQGKHTCIRCGEPIFENDRYYESMEGAICYECMEEMEIDEILGLCGESLATA